MSPCLPVRIHRHQCRLPGVYPTLREPGTTLNGPSQISAMDLKIPSMKAKKTTVEQSTAVSFSNQVSPGVVPQRQVPEDLRLNALILRRAPGAAHPAAVPLPVLKEVNEVKPDLLHPLGGGGGLPVGGELGIEVLVRPVQLGGEGLKL